MQPYHLYMFQTIAKEDKIQETIAGAVSLTSPTQETNLKKKGCNTFPSLASAATHILYTLFQSGEKYIIFLSPCQLALVAKYSFKFCRWDRGNKGQLTLTQKSKVFSAILE